MGQFPKSESVFAGQLNGAARFSGDELWTFVRLGGVRSSQVRNPV